MSHSGASGNLSATYAVTNELTLRGGVSSVFGGIDIEDNYTYWEFLPPFDYGTLDPARARNASLGLDWEHGRLKFGGELFITQIDNARGGTDNFDFESRGFNIGASYGWDTGFARFTLSKSDTTVDGDRTDSYDQLDFGAPLGTVMAFEVDQETGIDGLNVGGGIDAALDYEMPSGLEDLDGYTVVNAYAEYVPPRLDNITVRASVDNLFDRDYADRATYGNEYSGFTPINEPGRTFSLTVVGRF